MSKIYSGDPGPPPRVFIKADKGKPRPLHSKAAPVWGDSSAGAGELAFSILADALGDAGRARKLYGRFKHRVIADLKPDQPWTLTHDAVLATVADIEKTERDTAQSRRMVEMEPTPIVGGLGVDVGWTSEPELKPNITRKS